MADQTCRADEASHPRSIDPIASTIPIYTKPKRRRLMWADKTGLAIATVLAVISAMVWITVLLAAGTMTSPRLDNALAIWAAMAEFGIALPIWLALRAIDVLVGGRRRRNKRFRHGEMDDLAGWLKPQPG